jgi:hypothetical protein
MKSLLTALVLVATSYSIQPGSRPEHVPPTEIAAHRAPSDPFASEAAFRHRTCQPNHWRAMLMQK